MKSLPILLLASAVWAMGADDPHTDHPDAKPSTAAAELAGFKVPPGFEVQLVADESQIQKPVNLNFDAAGRLWVTGTTLYPWAAQTDAKGNRVEAWTQEWSHMAGKISGARPEPPASAADSVRVLSDFGADGRARRVEVFADGLNIPVGVMPLPRAPGAKGDAAIVFSIPSIWRLEDTDGDGHADRREELYSGFGFADTHGMSSNYLQWFDGWIYGCHGFRNRSEVRARDGQTNVIESGNTYRFRPDGSRFEVFTHGQSNPFGLTADWWGNFYSADSHSKPVYLLLPGAHYEGIGKQHDGLGFAPAITNDSHGSSAIAGIAWYADERFPLEYRGNVFIGNPVTQRINRDRFDWRGSTPMAVREPDFLTSDDPWFRPVQVKLGPDGALYVADFYNSIIGHYEQPLMDPRRDHAHGRIWRIVWRGEAVGRALPAEPPVLASLPSRLLVERLADPNLVVRLLAANELVARGSNASDEAQFDWSESRGGAGDAAALWVAERLGRVPPVSLLGAFDHSSEETAVQAARVLGERAVLSLEELRTLRIKLWSASPRVQRAIVQAMARHPVPENLQTLLDLWPTLEGGRDLELQHAVRVALRDHLRQAGSYAAISAEARAQSTGLLAEISLAVTTPEAAGFLLQAIAHRGDLARAGEYLGHAAKYLPADRFGDLVSVIDQVKTGSQAQQFALAEGLTRAARERNLPLPETVASWRRGVVLAALEGQDGARQDLAIAALKEEKDASKEAPLQSILQKVDSGGPRRAAALEALMNLPSAPETLARVMQDTSSPTLQRKWAEQVLARKATELARAALPTAAQDIRPLLARTLMQTDEGGAELLSQIESGKVPAGTLKQAEVAELLGWRGAALRSRAELLTKNLPSEDARLDTLIAARIMAYRVGQPDPAHGAEIFRANCVVCHKYRNEGANLAPNLDGISARGVDRLAEDILDPSRNVEASYRQVAVETADGRTIAGFNLRETDAEVTVTDLTGQDQAVPRAEVKARTVSKLSLMPAGFDTRIPEGDFADLLSYLLRPN